MGCRLYLSLDRRGLGWLYVSAVIDLFSRRVVGWSMQTAMTAQLVTDALVMAIWRRANLTLCCIIPIAAACFPPGVCLPSQCLGHASRAPLKTTGPLRLFRRFTNLRGDRCIVAVSRTGSS